MFLSLQWRRRHTEARCRSTAILTFASTDPSSPTYRRTTSTSSANLFRVQDTRVTHFQFVSGTDCGGVPSLFCPSAVHTHFLSLSFFFFDCPLVCRRRCQTKRRREECAVPFSFLYRTSIKYTYFIFNQRNNANILFFMHVASTCFPVLTRHPTGDEHDKAPRAAEGGALAHRRREHPRHLRRRASPLLHRHGAGHLPEYVT